MDYGEFLPHIDVKDGVTRVLNNQKLYFDLLKRFKGKAMTDNLLDAIASGNHAEVVQVAHALKGTAANLGFPVVYRVSEEIETLAKKGEPCESLSHEIKAAINDLEQAVAKLVGA